MEVLVEILEGKTSTDVGKHIPSKRGIKFCFMWLSTSRICRGRSFTHVHWAEIHKYYEECDWSKKVGRRIAENFNLIGLHRLDINDYLSTFFFIWCN